jgi:hypothetical protein
MRQVSFLGVNTIAFVSFLLLIAFSMATLSCPTVTLVYQPKYSQINQSSAGMKGNKYGLEDSIVVRRNDGGTFSYFSHS